MKWPAQLIIIRHAQSAYNELRDKKEADPLYRKFKKAFDKYPDEPGTRQMAEEIWKKHRLGVSDYGTPLSDQGIQQAMTTGARINNKFPHPNVIFVSPYLRTQETFRLMREGGFDIAGAKIVTDDRIREQEHGMSLIYNDWRVFQTLEPTQRMLRKMQGPYWYQYPQGESVSMVRDRLRSFVDTLIREYSGQVVYCISHHLTKLSIRANLERLTPEQFVDLDDRDKPVNCGITHYIGKPTAGRDGRLELASYNTRLY